MKRRSFIKRRTPLQRSTKPIPRSPIRKVSKKHRKRITEWAKISKEAIANVNGQCQVRVAKDCNGIATQNHHKLPRSRGGNENIMPIPCCAFCHDFIERNPKWARENGFTLGVNK